MGTAAQHELAPYLSAYHRRWLMRPGPAPFEVVDGSLLFLDVAGFTPLTERLATRGKAGAEELTDHLNGVFGDLIARSGVLGGDVLKFGGDALLLLFTAEGHEARAAAAAWDMQQAMRAYRRFPTSSGHASLRASAGVASGPVHLFIAGEAFSELVVAGPTVTTCLALEQEAAAGEILVAQATDAAIGGRYTHACPAVGLAEARPATSGGGRGSGGRRGGVRPAARSAADPSRRDRARHGWRAPPDRNRVHPVQGRRGAARRRGCGTCRRGGA